MTYLLGKIGARQHLGHDAKYGGKEAKKGISSLIRPGGTQRVNWY